jgi:hypothetical protein
MHSCVSCCPSLVGLGYVCETIPTRRTSSQKKLLKRSSTNLSQCLQICVVDPAYCFWLSLFLAFGWPCFLPLLGPLGSQGGRQESIPKMLLQSRRNPTHMSHIQANSFTVHLRYKDFIYQRDLRSGSNRQDRVSSLMAPLSYLNKTISVHFGKALWKRFFSGRGPRSRFLRLRSGGRSFF